MQLGRDGGKAPHLLWLYDGVALITVGTEVLPLGRVAQNPTLTSRLLTPAGMLLFQGWLLVMVSVPAVVEKAAFQFEETAVPPRSTATLQPAVAVVLLLLRRSDAQ